MNFNICFYGWTWGDWMNINHQNENYSTKYLWVSHKFLDKVKCIQIGWILLVFEVVTLELWQSINIIQWIFESSHSNLIVNTKSFFSARMKLPKNKKKRRKIVIIDKIHWLASIKMCLRTFCFWKWHVNFFSSCVCQVIKMRYDL